MFGRFKKEKKPALQFKSIDWNKVTEVDDLVMILKNCNLFKNVRIREDYWKQFEHLLEDESGEQRFSPTKPEGISSSAVYGE